MEIGTFDMVGDIDDIDKKIEDVLKSRGSFPGKIEVRNRSITWIKIGKRILLRAEVRYLIK